MESTPGGRGHVREEPRSQVGELELEEPSTESHHESSSGEVTQSRFESQELAASCGMGIRGGGAAGRGLGRPDKTAAGA